jgi:hypothetical protein
MVQYRKSKKVGPVRFTASTRGIWTSVGSGPFRVTGSLAVGYGMVGAIAIAAPVGIAVWLVVLIRRRRGQ